MKIPLISAFFYNLSRNKFVTKKRKKNSPHSAVVALSPFFLTRRVVALWKVRKKMRERENTKEKFPSPKIK